MKFLHISDLHIGKRVNEFPMIEDQRYILEQILEIAGDRQIQGVLIAGDIYDKSVPSAEAVQVFDRFLTGLADLGKKVFIVSGNHDSAERLSFGGQLMRKREVYVSPVYDGNALKIPLEDEHGHLFVYLLPFVKPALVRWALEREQAAPGREQAVQKREQKAPEGEQTATEKSEESVRQKGLEKPEDLPESYQDAVSLAVERMKVDPRQRNLLVAHQFVTGAGRCESEKVSVGGLDNVDAGIFDDFDYVALGHIHSPQWVKREAVRYCGTPLKYSFSEADQEKSVTVLELREKGNLKISAIPLKARRDMRRIRGTYMEVTAPGFCSEEDQKDYLQITLTDEEDVPDGFAKLHYFYPNLMRLEYDNSRTRKSQMVEAVRDLEQKSELDLFGEFYELQNNQPMSSEQEQFVREMIEDLKDKG